MSRSPQQRSTLQKQQLSEQEAAAASELFDLFCVATTMRQILGLHRDMCDILGLRPAPINDFYPKLKAKIRSWKAQALWKKFDARAAHRVYAKGTASTGTRVLVIGAGPCGMRAAIEAQLLGAKVVVLEKRDRITRNNVLHLWPFVITDLRNLGAKKFYGKFCAGSIDHISIRQLQIILMKVALLLGVEIHENVSFERTIEPCGDGFGWRASVSPPDHVVSYYEFDVLIGADGKRNTLEGFKRKEFRGKLAIAITANFINKKTEAEAKAEEISGVAFIFNQSFFKELYEKTGIDLENIVYYKDETHYFVMTAKKHSLIDKGVIIQDFSDPAELLATGNVNTEKLLDYAREAAEFSTKYQMPNLEFAVNHYGKPDVAMFDFTSMFAAETSCRVIMRNNYRLLQCLVGDSLLEPFWPTGSGCARGFLSSMDAAYAIKLWSNTRNSILAVVAQRESIYRLLGQTTPENLQRDTGSYTVDPASRYPNLNRTAVGPYQVKTLIDTDDPTIFEQPVGEIIATQTPINDAPVALRRTRRSIDTVSDAATLGVLTLRWVCSQLDAYDFVGELKEPADVIQNGKSLCALISRFRPDLIDYHSTMDLTSVERNDVAFRILETEFQIPRIMSGEKSINLDKVDARLWLGYLSQVREAFRGEVPHLKHAKVDIAELREKYRINITHAQPDFSKLLQLSTKPKYPKSKSPIQDTVDVPQIVQRRSVLDEERVKRLRRHEPASGTAPSVSGQQVQTDSPRRAKKRRNADKPTNIEERQRRLQEIEANRQERMSKRRQQRYQQTQNFYKSLQMLHANTLLRESDEKAFEDYSIFLYRQQAPEFNDRVKELERKLLYPDRDRSDIPSAMPRGNTDEQFSDRIKSMEQRISSRTASATDKKPKDLMRAIGKIDSSDWNVREIEKKIEQSKRTEIHGPKGREKVPKWSKEQFLARQHKMAKPNRQDSIEEKYKDIDQTLKNFTKQLKEGSVLEVGERGRNKVASIAGQFVKKDDNTSDEKNPPTIVPKPSAKVALAFKKQAASEKCHFCKQIVYLMEKITAEALVFHRSCLKCHHCHTNLRLGGYAFDRDDPNGRFYCTQHFRLPAKAIRPVVRKPGQRKPTQQQQAAAARAGENAAVLATENITDAMKTPDKLRGPADNVVQLDLLDRGQTPERIEFENTDAMSDGEPSEEHILDEHEWSGRNFLPESNQDSESDLSTTDDSDSDSDPNMFEEANDSPLGAQTLQLATDWIGKQNYSDSDDSVDFYDSSEGIADDGKDDTEGEEFKKARELRREEVRLLPLPANLPTDTETELKLFTENKENIEVIPQKMTLTSDAVIEPTQKVQVDNISEKSYNSAKSFKSAASSIDGSIVPPEVSTVRQELSTVIPPTKADIEKIEQTTGRKFSAEIEAISEKLHRLNSVVKMNKDLESLAKENLVKSDILKKLTMKEKWLADNAVGASNPMSPKQLKEKWLADNAVSSSNSLGPKATFGGKFTSKEDIHKVDSTKANETKEGDITNNVKLNLINSEVEQNSKTVLEEQKSKEAAAAAILESLKSEIKSANLNRANRESSSVIPSQIGKKPASRSNSFKSNASSSPKATTKSANVSRTNSLKRSEKFTSKDEAIAIDSRMQLQNILGLVKSIDNVTKPKNVQQEKNNELNNETLESSNSDLDMGKMLYDVENKFSPKADRRMSEKLKEIEARNFAGTMDFIKSQIVTPTVSAQATPVDLSKYFPNQKQQKSSAGAANKTQKNLKDVDLAKYFPTSPTPQKRTVVTVADKLKKSQTEKALAPTGNAPKSSGDDTAPTTTKTPAKRQASLSSSNFSLRDHQLDGAVDLTKKKTPVVIVKSNAVKAKSATVTTTAAAATVTKKGNVKVIKKILPKKGGKSKKVGATTGAEDNDKKIVVPRDEIDCKLDEILGNTSQEMRSPSLEYQKLFTEEKSPSEDISDKIERIYQETGIDLGIPKRSPSSNKKKLLKTKSLGEGEFDLPSKRNSLQSESKPKEYGDRPTGVQGLLQRFESMSTVKSFKLERMESSASNLNKSRESIVSHESIMSRDSLISRESDSLSDLEKTMEYLKTEWRNEATNFLQKKRDKFYSQKRAIDQASAAKESELKKSKFDDLPVQYRESKIAKFFGIKARSPEKRKSLIKNKSPEKKLAKKSPSPLKNARKVASLESSAVESKKPVSDILRVTTKKAEGPTKSEDHKSNTASENVTQKNGLSNAINDKFGEDKPKLEPKSLSENKVSKEVNNINTNSFNAVVTPIGPNEFIAEVVPITKISETLKENIPFQDAHLTKSTLSRQNSNSSNNLVSETNSPVLKRRPLVEDIRNLPKTGCDKSLSSSRRNSQSSLQSRRCSDSSLTEQLGMIDSLTKTLALDRNVDENFAPVQSFTKIISRDSNANEKFDPVESFTKTFSLDGNVDEKFVLAENFTNKLSRGSSANEKFAPLESFTKTLSLDGDVNEKFVRVENFTKRLTLDSNVDEQFKNIVDELDSVNVNNVHPNLQVIRAEDECDSLCTSISKSPSAAPTTVRVRGSSEDESIEKLFSQFSDAMLVNVEFDSNDELVAITPRVDLINDPDADKDYLDRWESLEKDDDMTMNLSTYAESTKMPRNSEKKGNIKNERSAEILKLKGNRNSKSLATDLEKELVRESKLSMPLSDTQATPFPVRPQRRQKSTSSSSEASTPIVPQRIKKKLAKLSPADMPPSVQDVLQVVISSNPPNQNEPLEKFPKNVSEDELIVESAAWKIKNEIPVHIGPRQIEESLKTKGDIHLNNTAVLKQLPNSECKQAELHKISNTSSNYDAVIHNSNNSCVNESLSSRASKTENVTERKKDFSVNQTKFKSDALLEKTIEKMNNFNNAVITPGSSRIKSLNATNHSSQESLNRSVNIGSSPKAASKERSLEWDMTKMPASPMPRRKFVHAERRGFDDLKLSRDSSPTTSIKILNNLSRNGSDSEESQKRIIEDFEIERRQALIERDKNFQDMVSSLPEPKKQDKESNSSNSKKSTSLPTPRSSRRSTHSSINVTRDGTPPMFKKLVVPSDDEISMVQPLSSRCSSFAFIELLSNGEAIVAPMPKPLNIPQTTPKYETPKDEPIPEVFQNRPWPRPQSESESCESPECDSIIEAKRAESEPKVPVEKVFLNRKWPDGKTVFKEEPEEDEFDESLLERAVTQRRTVLRPHSQTPPSRRKLLTAHDVMSAKSGSKSISDLRNQSPQISTYSSDQSLSHELASTHSSGDSGLSPRVSCESQPITTKTVTRHMPTGESVDVNTRMLLDRSKRLHNRKSDFMNERAAERNPYMRDVVNAERLERQALEKAQEELECYRPDHYTNPVTRFPTSRTLGRSRNVPTYQSSYTPSAVPAYTDYGLSNRRLYNPTLPTSVGSSLDYNPYSTRSSTAYGRGSSYNDYYKRSPSRQREREHSKESCVQSESESSSPEEVELNSATEISTDSEFDHDENICETPKIFIDDSHLKKPTKVQVKSTVIVAPSAGQKHHILSSNIYAKGRERATQKYQVNPPQPQFKPLVQVDPTLLTKNRAPLQNPRPGDYLLNKTASTEGIASKKSLELKKRYLLGEQGNGNKIQKSGSTSVLDSRIRSFQSNISECQKLLNPSSDISASMKTFLDRTKLGENVTNDLMRSATTNILNDLKVEITIQKASSTASTDNEKENLFVNSKNELNKGMEYSENINSTIVECVNKKSPTTPTNNHTILGTIDLVTPEKVTAIIDTIDLVTPEKETTLKELTNVDMPTKALESNIELINSIKSGSDAMKSNSPESNGVLLTADSNKFVDLTCESPVKSDTTIIEDIKPDVSKDAKQTIPDILGHIGQEVTPDRRPHVNDENQMLLSHSGDEEKMDSPEKLEEPYENETVQIQVPNIPWNTRKTDNMSSTTGSSCTSNSSSIEDIQHFILESTTSPDTQTGGITSVHQVPRVEIHDTTGTLMEVDSLMIIDGKYIGDPEDLKYMEIPEGVIVPEIPAVKTTEVEEDNEGDIEPVTATPEPAECTVIEAEIREELKAVAPLIEKSPPLPKTPPPSLNKQTVNLKFDTKNENKVESLKHLPLIVEQTVQHTKAVKPVTLNLSNAQKPTSSPTTPTALPNLRTPTSPLIDNDITPTAELMSKGSDSETEPTGTGQILTETELSDWTADDCISENFVDMEFVLNSNRGTIKRNKKNKKRISNSNKLPSTSELFGEVIKSAPVAEFEGILKSIDIDDIEFMDTGSEGSYAEAYSATNTALLRNRGYMEFIEAPLKQTPSHQKSSGLSANYKSVPAKRDEKLGVDYIEQGAYIMQDSNNEIENDLLKTPVNEAPQIAATVSEKSQTGTSSLMTHSLTDSSTLNDLEDDSLFTATPNSQTQLSSAATTKTTTEESEALTVVTSPLDSSSPKAPHPHISPYSVCKDAEHTAGSTPSSSDKNPKTSQSTWTPSSASTASSSKATPPRRLSQEIPGMQLQPSGGNSSSLVSTSKNIPRKPSNELSYEECVRALQQKITQISTARDSLDMRKQRRKSSKGEAASGNIQTVIDPAKSQPTSDDALPATANAAQIHKVPEIPTLTRKLEEITKERTKQKDLIHDLVMDKLQSKKQLNAEKRLHRSRQRTLLTSGYASGSSLSPTPKLAAAATTSDTNCTNQAHYHESTAGKVASDEPLIVKRTMVVPPSLQTNYKESVPLQKSATYVSAYGMVGASPTRVIAYKQRPFSEHIDPEQLSEFENYKLSKTPSFSYGLQKSAKSVTHAIKDENIYKYTTPTVSLSASRQNRTQQGGQITDGAISATTENLRSEARARAKLKTNTELGLSPEEKTQLLRQRLNIENEDAQQQSQLPTSKTRDRREQEEGAHDRRLSASKSVNDLAYVAAQQMKMGADENSNTKTKSNITADFTSDPNLLLSSGPLQINSKQDKAKPNRRQKDPERRKSLIQSLSSFFHKNSSSTNATQGGKENKKESAALDTFESAPADRAGTSGSNMTSSSSAEGVFIRFRISPKTKEKSKDKDEYAFQMYSNVKSTGNANTHKRSTSQDCIARLHQRQSQPKQPISHSTASVNSKQHSTNTKKSSTSALSSSSPQLFIHRPCHVANESDEQTPPPIPPLPLNYQRSDDESYATETREQKRQRAISKAVRQAELKRLRIAQEIQREQEEIEVELKELEARGVLIEKALRGEPEQQHLANSMETTNNIGSSDERLLKELLEIWRNIKQLKKRDEELGIRQKELQLEHRHAQLKEELNMRLSCNKLEKSSADVAAEGAILNEMLEIVAKRAALRPTSSSVELDMMASTSAAVDGINLANTRAQLHDNDESNI